MLPSKIFEKKRILVGVTGGIAAYKTCEFIRYLVTYGGEVRVMMTKSAEEFVSKLTMETLSGNPVLTEMFPESQFVGTHHISIADWADVAIVVPATANIIGKVANGIADDFVSTTLLAAHGPVVFAPAMNSNMWNNPAVQRNIKILQDDCAFICFPEEGFLAEGYSGVGRLARLEYLIQYLYKALHPAANSLKNKKIVVTGGRTEEALDPVRIFTNRSTGKMGFAMAIEAFARGAEVKLIHGPSHLVAPVDMDVIAVQNAEEMYERVNECIDDADIFIAAAAVADFRPSRYSQQKIKKDQSESRVDIERTKDILTEVSQKKKKGQHLIGFAVETESLEKNAKKKLESKNLDLVVLNNPLEENSAFAHDTNRVILYNRAGERQELPTQYKLDVAREIFDFLLQSMEQ